MSTQSNHSFSATDRKILFLAALGGMLEFYDFIIYGIFSVYFAHLFFPSHNSLMSIIASYVVFVLGYLARPIGGIIFSHIGDEHGRKRVLVITIVLMGLSSLGIGLLPTYAVIGIFAPTLLLALRLLQGLALGGELPSTYVYIRESIANKSSLAFGIIMSGIVSGLLLGTLVNFIINILWNHQQISDFGWRVPFILGGVLCLISYKIRQQLYETRAFDNTIKKPKFPLMYLLRHNLTETLIGTFITASLASSIVIFIIFMPTYLQKIVKLDSHIVSVYTLFVTLTTIIVTFFTGLINERRQSTLNTSFKYLSMIGIPLVAVCYYLISINIFMLLSMLTLGIIAGIFTMLSPAIITTLFPAQVRLSGVALCYNLGFSLFGGLAPVIITSFINGGANKFLTPIIYIGVIYLLGIIGISLIKNPSPK